MIIKELPYPAIGKRKFSVIHQNKEYTCYIHPYMEPGYSVFTGNRKTNDCRDITGSRLATEIFLHCK